jgi:hypothetical protein
LTGKNFISTLTIILAAAFFPPTLQARGLNGSLEIGFDSFSEKYSIVEEDTVDNVIELRSRLRLEYVLGSMLGDYFRMESGTSIGNNSVEESGRMSLARSVGPTRFAFSAYFANKDFRSNTTYSYANDYQRYDAAAYVQYYNPGFGTVRLTDRVEGMDFARRTEFDYDYLKNSVHLGLDVQRFSSTYLQMGTGGAVKSIPDTSQISYESYTADFEFRRQFGLQKQVHFSFNGERKIYHDRQVRSPYWTANTHFTLRPLQRGPWVLSLENAAEFYLYDTSNDVYFNYTEEKTSLLLMYFRSFELELGAGPMHSVLTSGASTEDQYREWGAVVKAEFLRRSGFWLSFTYEGGKRSYDSYRSNPESSIFSDYVFNRFTLFTSAKLWRNISVNGFLSHEPVNHKRAGDDTSTTLFSLDLGYAF